MGKMRLRDRTLLVQGHTAKENGGNKILLVPSFSEDDKGLGGGNKGKCLHLCEPLFIKLCKMADYEFKYVKNLVQCLANNWYSIVVSSPLLLRHEEQRQWLHP